jgi:hypothetical protein
VPLDGQLERVREPEAPSTSVSWFDEADELHWSVSVAMPRPREAPGYEDFLAVFMLVYSVAGLWYGLVARLIWGSMFPTWQWIAAILVALVGVSSFILELVERSTRSRQPEYQYLDSRAHESRASGPVDSAFLWGWVSALDWPGFLPVDTGSVEHDVYELAQDSEFSDASLHARMTRPTLQALAAYKAELRDRDSWQ